LDTSLRIAVVGAGPGGLTLARLLHLQGCDVTVFERDAGAQARPQGGTLDLHEDAGLTALREAGLFEAFRRHARYDDQGTRLLDRHGALRYDDPGSLDDGRPEIDRSALRGLLLESLPASCVRWGHALREARSLPDGRWMLAFADLAAEVGPYDLVVGADGANSRLRPLLSAYQPQYTGLTFVEFGIDDIDASHPALSRLVGKGKLVVEGEGKSIIAQRNGNAHVRGYAIFRVPAGWAAGRFDFASPAAVRAGLVREFEGFAPRLLDLFQASNDAFVARPIHALPVGHHWAHRRGLTLIGDAAHLMSPFAGEGVNAAMRDAVELARQLGSGADPDRAVAAHEAAMFERVVGAAQASAEGAATHLSHDGLALTEALYRSHREAATALQG